MNQDNDFQIGQPVLYGNREYIIIEVIDNMTIKLGIGELDLGCKHILEKCMEQHPEDYAFCMAKWFCIQKRLTHSHHKSVKKANPQKHKKVLEDLIKLDGLEPMDVIDLLHFALTDNFWKDHLLTLPTLRTISGNGQKRYINIQKALKESRKRGQCA